MKVFPVVRSHVLWCISCLLITASLSAQRYELWQHLDSRNGLPQNSVRDMVLDTAGYLWIATEGGLARYDGHMLKKFVLNGRDGKRLGRIRNFTSTLDKELIVEEVFGNAFLIKDHCELIPLRSVHSPNVRGGNMPSMALYQRMVDGSGSLPEQHAWWPHYWRSLVLDEHRWLSFGSDKIYLYTDTQLTRSIHFPEVYDHKFFRLGDDVLLMNRSGRVVRLDPRTGHQAPMHVEGLSNLFLIPDQPFSLFRSGPDRAYLCVQDRLYSLRPGRGLELRAMDLDLPKGTAVTFVLHLELEDIVVVGTNTQGLFLYRPKPMRMLRCSDLVHVPDNSFYAQLEMDDGRILTSRYLQEGLLIDPELCTMSAPEIPLSETLALQRDAAGHIFYCSRGSIIRQDPSTGIRHQVQRTTRSSYTFSFLGDTLWVADKDSIGYLIDLTFHWTASIGKGDEPTRPFMIRRDHLGRIWAATCIGIQVSVDRSAEAFAPLLELDRECARALEPHEDRMFIGTYGDGAFVFRNNALHPIPMDANKALAEVHSFFVDKKANLWMSTNHGLVRTTLKEIDAAIVDSTAIPYYALYSEWAGMTTSEFNGGCDPAVIELKNGDLSYPSMDGLVQFSPTSIVDPFGQGMVRWERVIVDGVDRTKADALILPSDVQEIILEFSMPFWGDPTNKQLEYRINGIQEKWHPLHQDAKEIRIVRPPAGEFQVIIRKVGGTIRGDHHQAIRAFSVERPFLLRWYGIALMAALLVLMVWGVVELNNIRLRQRTVWLRESVAAKTAELLMANQELRHSIEHQEKLISIISHDVVPPLRFVARVAHSAQDLHRSDPATSELGETLDDLSTSADKLFLNAKNLLDWIRSRSKDRRAELRTIAVQTFVEHGLNRIREMTDKQGIELVNLVDPEDTLFTDGDLIGIAMNNALLNMQLHAAASRIEVSATVTDSIYRLILRDNGVGIPKNVIGAVRNELQGISHHDDKDRSGAAVGLGFVIIAECMRTLGGVASVESADPGTRIIFDLPIRKAVH